MKASEEVSIPGKEKIGFQQIVVELHALEIAESAVTWKQGFRG